MKKTYLLLLFSIFAISLFAKDITIKEAENTARNFYFEKSTNRNITFENIDIVSEKGQNYYYIFDVKGDKGFVIVSANDLFYPIIGYSLTGEFITENQPTQVKSWMNHYVEQINYLEKNKISQTVEIAQRWNKYNVLEKDFKFEARNTNAVDPLVGDILWNQDDDWNMLCPEDAAGPGGHVYAGCVATAMSIILRYWEAPMYGTGSHSYYAYGYGTLSVNYANASYMYSMMPKDEPSMQSAKLMYHCGVSVNMGYAADGSGAMSNDVPDALDDYFSMHNAIYQSKGSNSAWISMLKTEINAGRPVYYSGRDDDNGGHAFVCSGYDANNKFHFNFGWSGSANGFYTVDDVGGFHNWQACVRNIYPATTNTLEPATSLDAELDMTTAMKVNLEWVAPTTKGLVGYDLYREDEIIAEDLPISQTSYSYVETNAGEYYYGIRAVYSNGEAICASDFLDVKSEFAIKFHVGNGSGSPVSMCQVTFNGETQNTNFFGDVTFNNVTFGLTQAYSVAKEGLNASGSVDVNEDKTVNVTLDATAINNLQNEDQLTIYPNPTSGIFNVNITDNKNATISVIDLTGKVIFTTNQLKQGKNTFNLLDFSKGMYIVKFKNNKQTVSQSIIIN